MPVYDMKHEMATWDARKRRARAIYKALGIIVGVSLIFTLGVLHAHAH